jgi:hypothetical protein
MKAHNATLRHEFKYYITTKTYQILRQRIAVIAERDENSRREEGYWVSSLYFDDVHNSALRDKIDGDRFRRKFRIRVYEHESGLIRLESKAKLDSWTAKESTLLTMEEYRRILDDDVDFLIQKKDPLCRELYALHKATLLRPKVIVEYEREAYKVREGNVRLTFDKALRSSIHGLDLFDPDVVFSSALPQELMIFEVKYDDFIPKVIRDLIQGQRMQRYAVSKYVICKKRRERVIHYD